MMLLFVCYMYDCVIYVPVQREADEPICGACYKKISDQGLSLEFGGVHLWTQRSEFMSNVSG